MDSEVELSIKRMENELIAARALFFLSELADSNVNNYLLNSRYRERVI